MRSWTFHLLYERNFTGGVEFALEVAIASGWIVGILGIWIAKASVFAKAENKMKIVEKLKKKIF